MPTLQTFLAVIQILLDVAEAYGQPHKDIRAGDLHTFIGGYPSPNHRMPQCNNAMRQMMLNNDTVLIEPPQGQGATLTIRYFLPRNL